MSGDEVLAAIVCLLLNIFTWGSWAFVALSVRQYSPAPSAYLAPWIAAPITAALVFAVLARFASHDVRDSGLYIGFYLLMTLAATGLGLALLDRLGLSLRDDVLERRNPAACIACSGAIIGIGLAFAGANIGDGPGWWVVVFSGGLSVGGLLIGWIVIDRIGQAGEAIVVERDEAAGLRVEGWFVAAGAITGRAAAGNWVSAGATVADFSRIAWGALGLTILAAVVESLANHRGAGQTRPRGAWIHGVSPALLWLGLSAGYLAWTGPW
jgi:hypothetical protein